MADASFTPELGALLGPTNTGKTHRAVERMLEHPSGMLGLPLRLLAREVYDRVSARIGQSAVALVTGEEKRVPRRPRYWICTVEAMPVDLAVDYLAVDEIQLAAHPERGHVFTDRLLRARGKRETLFMGSDTMSEIFHDLLPEARIQRHPRLSQLSARGQCKLSALPPRSAVVAFSMTRVYQLAERIKQRRGGTAVVLGALSPRARNAQVAMYQSGEVAYMVATDAIGMGLNMDVDHVAFADLEKFDGRETRGLVPAELAQIAGRAGRHLQNGSFGTLAPAVLSPEVSRLIERHRFSPERSLIYRNSQLDTTSIDALIESLRSRPSSPRFKLVEQADDFDALLALAERADVRERALDRASVALLWEACQIPDYRKLMMGEHPRLVGEIFLQLSAGDGRLEPETLQSALARIDDAVGDLETLLARLAAVRTWTYVSQRPGWVEDADTWQARTREIEDRLSDALHEQLVARFVEQKRRSLSGRRGELDAETLEGPFAALLELKRKLVEPAAAPEASIEAMLDAPHESFGLNEHGAILAFGRPVARLSAGRELVHPEVVVDVELAPGLRLQMERRLRAYLRDLIKALLAPLELDDLPAGARGLAYQLAQGLGTLSCTTARRELDALDVDSRNALQARGVVLGRHALFLPELLKPSPVKARFALVTVHGGLKLAAPRPSSVSLPLSEGAPLGAYPRFGFLPLGPRAFRADIVERAVAAGADRAQLQNVLGCPRRELDAVLARLAGKPRRHRRRRAGRRLSSDREA